MAVMMPITRSQIEDFSDSLLSSVAGQKVSEKRRQTARTLWKMINNFNKGAEAAVETASVQDRNADLNNKLIKQNVELADSLEGLESVQTYLRQNAEKEDVGADTLTRLDRLVDSGKNQLQVLQASADLNVSNADEVRSALEDFQEVGSEFKPAMTKLSEAVKSSLSSKLTGADSFVGGLLGDVLGVGGLFGDGLFSKISGATSFIKDLTAPTAAATSLEAPVISEDPDPDPYDGRPSHAADDDGRPSHAADDDGMVSTATEALQVNQSDLLDSSGDVEGKLDDIYLDHGSLLESINERLKPSVTADDERFSSGDGLFSSGDGQGRMTDAVSAKRSPRGDVDTDTDTLFDTEGFSGVVWNILGGSGLTALLLTKGGAIASALTSIAVGVVTSAAFLTSAAITGTSIIGGAIGYLISKIKVGEDQNGDPITLADANADYYVHDSDERVAKERKREESVGDDAVFWSAHKIAQSRGVDQRILNNATRNVLNDQWTHAQGTSFLRDKTKAREQVTDKNFWNALTEAENAGVSLKILNDMMDDVILNNTKSKSDAMKELADLTEWSRKNPKGPVSEETLSLLMKTADDYEDRMDTYERRDAQARGSETPSFGTFRNREDESIPLGDSSSASKFMKESGRRPVIVQPPTPTADRPTPPTPQPMTSPPQTSIDDIGLHLLNSSMLEA